MTLHSPSKDLQSHARANMASIKNRRVHSNLPLSQQLATLRRQPGKLSQFYCQEKTLVVTEDEVKAGLGGFQVLIDPFKVKEVNAEVEKQRRKAQ